MIDHVFVLAANVGSPIIGPNLRTFYCAQSYIGHVSSLKVITSSYSHKYHPNASQLVGQRFLNHYGIEYVFMRGIHYNNTFKRVLAMWLFTGQSVCYLFRALAGKPRNYLSSVMLICSTPSLEYLFTALLSKLFFPQIKFVWDIRDIWPLALNSKSLLLRINPYSLFYSVIEAISLKRADLITTPLSGFQKYLDHRGSVTPCSIINNCISESNFSAPMSAAYTNLSTDIADGMYAPLTSARPGCINLVYAGSIDRDNDVETIIQSLSYLDHSIYSMHIIGDGPLKQYLSVKYSSPNLHFYDQVQSINVYHLLLYADICLMALRFKPEFGYGVALNKTYEYMRASKPIVFACQTNSNPVSDSACGVTVPPSSPSLMAEAIMSLIDQQQISRTGHNGYLSMINHYSESSVATQWRMLLQ